LKNGGLVGFPTETVYGLGANSFSEEAIKSIFHAKERPYTDPIISHVTGYDQALTIVDTSKEILGLFKFLADTFWPGPMTVVMKANLKIIPMVHTGGTGFIGVRCPNNKIALKMIQAGVPIGAPSANLFGHVSPSKPIHVFNDLYNKNIDLINGNSTINGVESTVLKINQSQKDGVLSIMVLRNGSLSPNSVAKALKQSDT